MLNLLAVAAVPLDGLGANGNGAHSPDERVNLNSVERQTERATLPLYRLVTGRTAPAASIR